MSGPVLFEANHKGDRWRLEVTTFNGRTFANWRKWYPKEGVWTATKSGCTFPPERLWELMASLMAHHGLTPPSAPQTSE